MRVVLDLILQARLEPNHRALNEEDLGITLIQKPGLMIPLATFDEHSTNVNTVNGRRWVIFLNNLVVEDQLIDWNLILSCVVLHGTGEETLGEEELVDPVELWDTVIDPALEELKSLFQILNIASQWFQ